MSQAWYIPILSSLASSLVVAFVAAYLTVKFALRRFYTERWWERKAETYSRIVEALHNHKQYAEANLRNEFTDYSLRANDEKLEQQWREANKELKRAVDLGAFMISEEAETIIQDFINRKLPEHDEAPFFEIIEKDLEYVQDCLVRIKAAAKKDLRF